MTPVRCMARTLICKYSSSYYVSRGSFREVSSAGGGRSQENHKDLTDNDTATNAHTVQWNTASGNVVFAAYDGELLRTAALRRGVVSPHNSHAKLVNCRGLGTCGTCAVEIKGSLEPVDRSKREKIRLSLPPHNSKSQSPLLRLACQVQVRGDLTVTKRSGIWGQGTELSKESEHKMYLEDLEFIFDKISPADVLPANSRK
jgi:ferredoxin